MSMQVRELSSSHAAPVASLWQAATTRRRAELGLGPPASDADVLARPDVFGVGAFDGAHLVAMAVAMPALADDARSSRNVPGLAHISSVATRPDSWGQGLGAVVVRAVMSQAIRRGYARTQLWTHATNPRARRLYERAGFTLSGRERVDDSGEPIVHYLRELPAPPILDRPAARVVCVDAQRQVLLMHWRDPYDGHQLWEPPGGGLEPAESTRAAAEREWREETGLPLPEMAGEPTWVARDVLWRGGRIVTAEDFFWATTTQVAPQLAPAAFTDAEQVDTLGHAWIRWDELDTLDDPVEPDLLPVLRRLDPSGPWAPDR
jgi:8-oxo-dGTP pyrophosphatase MutT (NUDIX family)/GNAT superfamily N-acetyltransferase